MGACCADDFPANESAQHARTMSAVEVARHELGDLVGVELPAVEVPIAWWWATPDGCLDYGDGWCARGAYLADCVGDPLRIDLTFYDRIEHSSLAHELVHYWSHVTQGDSDHGHEGPWWQHVAAVNAAISRGSSSESATRTYGEKVRGGGGGLETRPRHWSPATETSNLRVRATGDQAQGPVGASSRCGWDLWRSGHL